jgi:UDP-N-acetylglucosamine 2-epimerase (non-hydrolysing)
MREVLEHYRPGIEASEAPARLGLERGQYFLVSAHREETVDSPERLGMLLDCLRAVRQQWGHPVVVSTHPRTRKRLADLPASADVDGIQFMEPFGFFDYNRLQLDAACVLSDSGTISEESALLGFPAVTLRESIERPEALDAGAILMTGLDADDVVAAVSEVMREPTQATRPLPAGYEVTNTAERTCRFILSTARRHRLWAGIR